MRASIVALALFVLGCKATIPSGRFSCLDDSGCPQGFVCAGGLCVTSAPPPDGGSDGGAGETDGGVSDEENTLALCSDASDNDGDGEADCEDASCCSALSGCAPASLCGRCMDGEVVLPTRAVKASVLLIPDSSASMQDLFGGGTMRWAAMREVLVGPAGVVREFDTRLRFGAMTITGMPGAPVCSSFPSVPMQDASFAAIDEFIRNGTRAEGTSFPVEGFARVAMERVSLLGIEPPFHILYFVDSDPGTCAAPNDRPTGLARMRQAVAELYAAGVSTTIIGITDNVSEIFADAIARAGSGDARGASGIVRSSAELAAATREAVLSTIPCQVALDEALPVAADLVTVRLGDAVLPGNVEADGWRLANERTIELLGAACIRYRAMETPVTASVPCTALQ